MCYVLCFSSSTIFSQPSLQQYLILQSNLSSSYCGGSPAAFRSIASDLLRGPGASLIPTEVCVTGSFPKLLRAAQHLALPPSVWGLLALWPARTRSYREVFGPHESLHVLNGNMEQKIIRPEQFRFLSEVTESSGSWSLDGQSEIIGSICSILQI